MQDFSEKQALSYFLNQHIVRRSTKINESFLDLIYPIFFPILLLALFIDVTSLKLIKKDRSFYFFSNVVEYAPDIIFTIQFTLKIMRKQQTAMIDLEFKSQYIFLWDYNYIYMDQKKKQQNLGKKNKWSDQEKKLLLILEPQYSSKKWKQLSKELKNHGYSRTEVECREKWVNQLNPDVKKVSWEDQQLEILFVTYRKYGSHWSLIEKKLRGRTQNMIKNKFYSLLRNVVRFILRTFRENAEQTRKILQTLPTKLLQNLYSGTETFAFLGDLIMSKFEQMNYKMERNEFKEYMKNNSQKFKKIYEILKNHFQIAKEGIQLVEEIKQEYSVVEQIQSRQNCYQMQPLLEQKPIQYPTLTTVPQEISLANYYSFPPPYAGYPPFYFMMQF